MRIALVGAELEENLSIRYIWSALQQDGHEVVPIVFNTAADLDRAARKLCEAATPLAGFSMVFTARAREFADLARRARALGYAGHIVAGGHFAAFNADALLQSVAAFDSIAIGEGESILCTLAREGADASRVNGLVWRSAHGGIVRNPPAEAPQRLDVLPPPVRKWPPDRFLGLPIVNILASRGCTHACHFCSISAWHRMCGGARHRVRTVECVADEMAALFVDGVRIFNFHDDNFLLRDRRETLSRLAALRRELDERGVGRIAFAIKARPDEVHRDVFEFLVSMGLFRVFLGIEAGTAESLRNLGRGQTVDQNEAALAAMNDLGIHCCFNLLLLNPDSSLEDFAANLAFLKAHPHNPMNFCRTEIYAGTPLEKKMAAAGRLRGDFWGHDYTIADPRAETAFHLMREAFRDRCQGLDALHHLVMAVDYEHQLFAHFHRGSEALRRRVKDYIVDVNLDTCAHLGEIAAHCRREGSTAARGEFARGLQGRLDRDTARLRERGWELVAEIREIAEHARREVRTHRSGKAALATGLAVAAALDAGCAPPFQTEMAPDSTIVRPSNPEPRLKSRAADPLPRQAESSLTFTTEMAPEPTIIADGSAAKSEIAEKILPLIGLGTNASAGVVITFYVDEHRKVGSCYYRVGRGGPSANLGKASGIHLASLPSEEAWGGYEVKFTADELKMAEAAVRVRRTVLQELASLVNPQDLRVVLWLDRKGKPTKAAVGGASLTAAEKEAAERVLGFNPIDVPAAFGRHFSFEFTRGEFEK